MVLFVSSMLHVFAVDPLALELQAVIDNISSTTGYAVQVGYLDTEGRDFGIGAGSRTPAGSKVQVPGNVTGDDTMLLGSGGKPLTAAAVMRLVDKGKVSLNDLASSHIDEPMKAMWNTSFVGLFGANASTITVGHLLRMQSGLNDFDVPAFDQYSVVERSQVVEQCEDGSTNLRYCSKSRVNVTIETKGVASKFV